LPEELPQNSASGDPEVATAQAFVLRLYIAGASPRSSRALQNIQRICEKHLQGQYELEVVDLYQQPARAAEGQILAAPTLVRETPEPTRRLVGDMSSEPSVLKGLGVPFPTARSAGA
jgi:circadian clock protein KaiB